MELFFRSMIFISCDFYLASGVRPDKLRSLIGFERNLFMLGKLSIFASLAVCLLGTSTTWALDPTYSAGTGGVGPGAHVTVGFSRGTDDSMARVGVSHLSLVGTGLNSAGSTLGINKSSTDGFNKAGMSKANLAGVGRSTMETVPGRSPTYIYIVSGVNSQPMIGSRGL
jgi:hypothetical protein